MLIFKIFVANLDIHYKLFYKILLIIKNTLDTNKFIVFKIIFNLINILVNYFDF